MTFISYNNLQDAQTVQSYRFSANALLLQSLFLLKQVWISDLSLVHFKVRNVSVSVFLLEEKSYTTQKVWLFLTMKSTGTFWQKVYFLISSALVSTRDSHFQQGKSTELQINKLFKEKTWLHSFVSSYIEKMSKWS